MIADQLGDVRCCQKLATFVARRTPFHSVAMDATSPTAASAAAATAQRNWGKIGHPVQSRGLSAKDRTPWFTLLVTSVFCLLLGRTFLKLQRSYEQDQSLWAGTAVRRSTEPPRTTEPPSNAVRRAGAAGATALRPDGGAAVAALGTAPAAVNASAGGAADALAGLDASCGAEANLDLDGFAVSWGLDFHTDTAAACCEACKRHTKTEGQPGRCNSWVWCPEKLTGKCWSPDIWDHRYQECWLKVQEDPAKPKVNHRGDFPAAFRLEHKTAPQKTPWVAGVLRP